MSIFNKFDLEFFDLATLLKESELNKNEISKTLLKLNNPTYFGKYTTKSAGERHGIYNGSVKNPLLVAIQNMLSIIKQDLDIDTMKTKLQTEFAWAYNNCMYYKHIDL